ncbi:hypothetical protein E4K67_01460 [Desulfosporosinus fructosivorans]|uniref:TIGR04086 family membrane protein n=1 Tax=Desulfosporosinus fructosivorans TaxID=2018669 RepID=A0A4Z0RCK5_9FIRM|nr:TIGR04086 family membrane protein [Desulfosporosinus fructosivorans]TGE39693.1 hypothetical protein E4K67_01460 [Desulfosporosinus fructosivorans]
MGPLILRGITTALLVTVLTLFAGIVWGITGLGGLSISRLLDIGLLASCIVGGYRTAKESGEWLLGGIVGVGYVTVGTLLLALFLPIRGWGFIQVLAEGVIIGLVAGAVGAGGAKGTGMSAWSGKRSQITPSYADYETDDRYETNDSVNSTFDWDEEEVHEDWKEPPITNWIESSERDYKGRPGAKGACEKSPDVQWPWDKEEEKLVDSGPRQLEPFVGWEPDSARTDLVERNKASLSKNIAWWEQ